MRYDVYLEILSSFEGEATDLPDPSGPLRETVLPTAIVTVNVKVNEALNEAELKRSASRAYGTY